MFYYARCPKSGLTTNARFSATAAIVVRVRNFAKDSASASESPFTVMCSRQHCPSLPRGKCVCHGSLCPEPFGMAGPEAMRGLPVVAFDAGGSANGLLIVKTDTSFLENVDLFAARLNSSSATKHWPADLARAS